MTSAPRSNRASLALILVLLAGAAPLHYAAHQTRKARRFEIGSMDRDFLADSRQLSSPTRMSGPIRYEDGSVEVIDFYGRIGARRVELEIPYHVLRSPLRLFLRAHRFGLQGRVLLTANAELLGEFVFGKTSYPWGGIRAIVPQHVAERGALRLELVTEGGDPPPSHMPEEMGVGLDWIEVSPMSEGAILRPTGASYGALYVFVLSGFAFAFVSRLPLPSAAAVLGALVVLACAATALFPVETAVALARLWIVFPFAAAVYLALTRVLRTERDEASFVARLAAAAVLAHSVLIFAPNHLPPDVPLHAVQVSWLSSVDISYSGLVEYSKTLSRSITEDAVLMATERGDSPDASAAAPRAFGAPYTPLFYVLAHSISRFHPDLRFILEMLAVVMAASMLVLVYLAAETIWKRRDVARMAAVLFAMEISVWHHASRGHAPGIFGALFVLLFLRYLVSVEGSPWTPRDVLAFGSLTGVVALSYTVAFIQISMFACVFAAYLALSGDSRGRKVLFRMLFGFTLGIAAAVAIFYAPYLLALLAPSRESDVLLARAAAYDPPATFYFLRNQLRDTVRILQNGHLVEIALSALGLAFVPRSGASPYHRRWIWAGVSTYALMLILKDPAFLPRIFLHIKEDLFFAPFACMVGALPMAWLWSRRRLRPLAVAALLVLFYLSVRDKAWNADTLHPQPIGGVTSSPTGGRAA